MRFRRSSEGLSPVVGTLLVILIIVVIAAVATLVWRRAASDEVSEPPPDLGFRVDDGTSSIIVVHGGDSAFDWFEDLRVEGDCTPTLNGGPYPTSAGTLVQVNDRLTCGPGQHLLLVSQSGRGEGVIFDHTFA